MRGGLISRRHLLEQLVALLQQHGMRSIGPRFSALRLAW
jgi:hypothetical protein